MRLFRRLAEQRQDRALNWLVGQVEAMLGARQFVAHSVAQEDAIAEDLPALFILQSRHEETMITTALARKNAQMIGEGIAAPGLPAGDREVSPDGPVRVQRLGHRGTSAAENQPSCALVVWAESFLFIRSCARCSRR